VRALRRIQKIIQVTSETAINEVTASKTSSRTPLSSDCETDAGPQRHQCVASLRPGHHGQQNGDDQCRLQAVAQPDEIAGEEDGTHGVPLKFLGLPNQTSYIM
jgi:hypothetical protein